jgi:hypothetical protein
MSIRVQQTASRGSSSMAKKMPTPMDYFLVITGIALGSGSATIGTGEEATDTIMLLENDWTTETLREAPAVLNTGR